MILTLLLGLGAFPGWGLLGTWAQDPGTRFSESLSPPLPPEVWRAEAEDSGDPVRRNWCPHQMSRLVTFVAACKTEKFFVHSQQPCPQGAPDCQKVKVMYRVAQKPVYQIKQKVLTSVAWRCCPGFAGPDCQLHDPTATPEPADPGDDLQEPWDRPVSFEPERQAPWWSTAPGDVQNDLDQEDDSPPAAWEALADNLTAVVTEINQTEANQTTFGDRPGVPERPLEQALLLHVDSFLRQHFAPLWRSFNQSLHSLSEAVRNVSRELDAHQQALGQLQAGTVAKADLQELGAKFETKIQETAQKMDQLQEDVEDRLHAQHLSVQMSLSEMENDVDAKFKKLLKAQESEGSLLLAAAAAAGARPEPESLQARLGQLQRNLSALLVATGQREQELRVTLADMAATLAQHGDEIKELYNESDETFDLISRVERLVEELQVNHTALRELRIILMEKSLILEENKAELERQILELNLTLQQVQGGHTDLIKYVKGCNCQKFDLDAEGIPRDTPRALEEEEEEEGEEEETRVHLGARRPQDGSSLRALRGALDALSLAVDAQRDDSSRAQVDLARLRSELQALGREVSALQAAEGAVRREIGLLHSSFAALLDDALRHEAVLAALFGEEVMEAMNDEAPGPLPLGYEQIRVGLQEAASGLQEQAIGWDVLAARVTALEERAAGDGAGRARPLLPTAHLEPSHDASPEEASGTDLAGLAQELQRLSTDVKRVGLCCEAAGAAATNSSLEGLRQALSTAERGWEQHQMLFRSLFGNFQGLLDANVSLDLGKLQAMLNRKGKKQKKGLETPRRRDRREAWADEQGLRPVLDTLGAKLWAAGSPVAFYSSFSKGTTALETVKFNTTYLNIGSSYFPDTGYFQAPERGVYLFAVSLEFGAGPGAGQLVFGGHHRTPVHSLGGNTVTTFALAEMQKGERVWFELTRGSIVKKNPSSTAFGGFLMFQT